MLSFSSSKSFTTAKGFPNLHSLSNPFSDSISLRLNPPTILNLGSKSLQITAIDAAQPYDYETQLRTQFNKSNNLKIAIIGFGNFGQFLAKTFVKQGHTVLAHSRSNYVDIARKLGVSFFQDPHDLCEEHPEVVLLCSSILSTKSVLKSLPFQRLRRNTLFVDVLSVKEFPRNLFLETLPAEFDILCTHPMFGPESGKKGWAGLPFVYDKVRIGNDEFRMARCSKFLDIFAREGCRMVEMTCAEHDKYAAGSQFITHTMGRVLERFGLESTEINTKGYETLLNLVENTAGDSFDLYYGLFVYNNNAMEQLERLDMAFESIKKEIFGYMHRLYRKQLFEDEGGLGVSKDKKVGQKLLYGGSALELPSDTLPPNGAAREPPSETVKQTP
ncbi:arogenate dehydrogenase 2, chloroplastic-like [Vitis riparia]|uniref:arogenate dehydrogenase 2, chloroplastic-like n=1 Tax=Vitis riparia TaxID=96939 RepID=UPI00155A677E|nr:arogenate dehydrogenase 2, chloroplastic-like [Vitis riparia]